MCTYEDLVAATLPYGLSPLVVPQLKTITLGGAVTGLGIESASFRNGLPHESVLEMDILTGTGEVVTASRDAAPDLFSRLPQFLWHAGLFGAAEDRAGARQAVRRAAAPAVSLAGRDLVAAMDRIIETGGLDGDPGRLSRRRGVQRRRELPVRRHADRARRARSATTPDSDIYYRSIQHAQATVEKHDRLTIHDYLWRWDTDWFWCSRAFGAQNPSIRRWWPRRYRRSSFYWKLIGYDQRFDIADRIEKRNGRPPRNGWCRTSRCRSSGTAEFLHWFLDNVPIEPIWLCPLRLRDDGGLAALPDPAAPQLRQHRVLVVGAGRRPKRGTPTRLIEARSATSTATSRCTPTPSTRRRSSTNSTAVRLQDREEDLRPRFTASRPVREGGATTMTTYQGTAQRPTRRGQADAGRDPGDLRRRAELPLKFTAYDGSSAGPDDADAGAGPAHPARHHLPGHRPGRLGLGPRLRRPATWSRTACTPAIRTSCCSALADKLDFKRPPARVLANIVRSIGIEHLRPIAPPPQEALPRWRRFAEGLRHSKTRDAEAIHHHYDVSNTFYEWVLGPSMTYTCACYPSADATLEEAQENKYRLVFEKLRLQAGRPAARRRLRLGRHGALRGAARGQGDRCHPVARSRRRGRRRRSPSEGLADLAEVRHSDYRDVRRVRFRRGVLDRADRAHRGGELPGVLRLPASPSCAPAGCCSTTASPATTTGTGPSAGGFIDRYVFPDGELTGSGRIITEAQDVGLEVVHEENLRHHYAMTLRDWCRNLVEHWDEAVAEVGLATAKVWGLYMAGSRVGFETERVQLHQVLAVKLDERGGDGGLPLRPWWTP